MIQQSRIKSWVLSYLRQQQDMERESEVKGWTEVTAYIAEICES